MKSNTISGRAYATTYRNGEFYPKKLLKAVFRTDITRAKISKGVIPLDWL